MGTSSRGIGIIPEVRIIYVHVGNQPEDPEGAWIVSISGGGVWQMAYSKGVLTITPHLTAGDLGRLRVTIGDLMRSMNPDYDRRSGLVVVQDGPSGVSSPTHIASAPSRPSRGRS
jgi:hypothetical protein